MARFAQPEAEPISKRTRAALAQKKVSGFTLGSPQNRTGEARRKGVAIIKRNA